MIMTVVGRDTTVFEGSFCALHRGKGFKTGDDVYLGTVFEEGLSADNHFVLSRQAAKPIYRRPGFRPYQLFAHGENLFPLPCFAGTATNTKVSPDG